MILLDYLKEFQGIIGVLLGLIIGQSMRNKGKVIAHPVSLEHEELFIGPEASYERGGLTETGIVMGYRFRGEVLFENTSESMKSIRDLEMKFITNFGEKTQPVKMETEERDFANRKKKKDITFVNLPAKSITPVTFLLSGDLSKISYKKGQSLYLQYKISNKKWFKTNSIPLKIEV